MIDVSEEQRKIIIQIANTNLLVGMHHATVEQQAYVESTGLKGKAKQTYSNFKNAGNSFTKEWQKTPQMFGQSEAISDMIHDLLFKLREKLVSDYMSYVEQGKEE